MSIDKITTNVRQLNPFPIHTDYDSWSEYSVAMATALAQMNPYSIDTRALIVALNNMIEQINSNTSDVESATQAVKDEATKAIKSIKDTQQETQELQENTTALKTAIEQIIATLPEGTINDSITSPLHTWSSSKISGEISEKTAQAVANKAFIQRAFTANQEISITMTQNTDTPLVAVQKEVPSLNLTNSSWTSSSSSFGSNTDELVIGSTITIKQEEIPGEVIVEGLPLREVSYSQTGIDTDLGVIVVNANNVILRASMATDQPSTGFKYLVHNITENKTYSGSLDSVSIGAVKAVTAGVLSDNSFVLAVQFDYGSQQLRVLKIAETGVLKGSQPIVIDNNSHSMQWSFVDNEDNLIWADANRRTYKIDLTTPTPTSFSLPPFNGITLYDAGTTAFVFENGNILIMNNYNYGIANSSGTVLSSGFIGGTIFDGLSAYTTVIVKCIKGTDDTVELITSYGNTLYYAKMSNDGTVTERKSIAISSMNFYLGTSIARINTDDLLITSPIFSTLKTVIWNTTTNTVTTPYSVIGSGYATQTATSADGYSAWYLTTDNNNLTKVFRQEEREPSTFDYITNKYLTATTKSPVYTNLWTDINSFTATDAGSSLFYSFSNDYKVSFKVYNTTERTIARRNGSIWEYNSNTTHTEETWTPAAVNSEYGAINEAVALPVNRMTKSQLLYAAAYMPIENYLHLAVTLFTSSTATTPTFTKIAISYDGFSKWQEAELNVDYQTYQDDYLADNILKFKALAANNLKIRVV